MGGGRDPAAQDTGGDGHGGINLAHCSGGQHDPGGNADKCMDGIPAAINPRGFIGKKFHRVHQSGGPDNHGILQDLQLFGQNNITSNSQKAKNPDGRIEVDAGGPGGAHSQGDGGDKLLIGIHDGAPCWTLLFAASEIFFFYSEIDA